MTTNEELAKLARSHVPERIARYRVSQSSGGTERNRATFSNKREMLDYVNYLLSVEGTVLTIERLRKSN